MNEQNVSTVTNTLDYYKGKVTKRTKLRNFDNFFSWRILPGNLYWRGRRSTVDLLIEIGCFAKIYSFSMKSNWSELVCTTALILLIEW